MSNSRVISTVPRSTAWLQCVPLLVLAMLVLPSGCLFRKRGPAPGDLVQSRQLSLNATSALQRGDHAAAEALLERAVSTCDIDPEARRLYADCLVQRGDHDAAISQLDAAIKLATEDSALLIARGEVYLKQGDLSRAAAEANAALLLDRQSAAAWRLRARAAQQLGRPESALADYHRAISLIPEDRSALLEIAQIYWTLGHSDGPSSRRHYQQSLVSLQAVLDTYPEGEEPQHTLYLAGLVYGKLSRHEDAVRVLTAARGQGPDNPQLLQALAQAQLGAGRRQQAWETIQQALVLAPGDPVSLRVLNDIRVAMNPGRLR